MAPADIVPVENTAALDALDPQAREIAITRMLDQARTWLAHAVESTAPAQDIANFKAVIATAAETAKRLKVSKEIQQDAEVMVRRSERALGQAIRAGQERGEIAKRGERTMPETYMRGGREVPGGVVRDANLSSPKEFVSHNTEIVQVYAMADDVTDEQFEAALTESQEEGNVSRANVVRKVREVVGRTRAEEQAEKWDRAQALADQGMTSPQIARELGMTEGGFKAGAKQRGINVRADRIVGRARRLDMRRVIGETVLQLESIAEATDSLVTADGIRAADITEEEIRTWVDSLNQSLNALRKATNRIKESIS